MEDFIGIMTWSDCMVEDAPGCSVGIALEGSGVRLGDQWGICCKYPGTRGWWLGLR